MILRHSSSGDQRFESNTKFPNNFPGTMDGSTVSEMPVIVPPESGSTRPRSETQMWVRDDYEPELYSNENDCNIPNNRKAKPSHYTIGNVSTRGRKQIVCMI